MAMMKDHDELIKEEEERKKCIDEIYQDTVHRELLKKMGYVRDLKICKNCRYYDYGYCIYNAIHIHVEETGQCYHFTKKE